MTDQQTISINRPDPWFTFTADVVQAAKRQPEPEDITVERDRTGRIRSLYRHDCDKCIYLGPYRGRVFVDLYWCPTGGLGHPTILARYSNDGPDYVSGYHLTERFPELAVAEERAEALGLRRGK